MQTAARSDPSDQGLGERRHHEQLNRPTVIGSAGYRRRDADVILRAAAAGGAPEPYGRQAERLAELGPRLRREHGDDVPPGWEPDLEAAVTTALAALESLG